ncbi:Fic family protein [Methyloglobulus sp.]|uniref:Fic family protein n=1 Tax=Methyloglobulus sp. TaxID=2518622 RepID=UPI0032B74B2F
MHIPISPPEYSELLEEIVKQSSPKRLIDIFSSRISPEPKGKYYHWDKLRHLSDAPNGLNHREWWFGIKSARQSLYQALPHKAKNGSSFVYAETNSMRSLLHKIDLHGGGELKSTAQVANPATRDSYLINSLIEEAITSSQLEGAATTRKVAKEMLREKRLPRDRSERMIVNNYTAMEFINEIGNEDLTPEIILRLQEILTENTLDNENAIGKWRGNDEVYVGDERDATILHIPPTYKEVPSRIEKICNFANDRNQNEFLHPVIRAVLLHFLLAYDHPFEDGNGRTARALFYWSMLRQGYWTMEFVSISRILKKAPAQYNRSYLYTETDQDDVTYFILHQLKVILRSIEELLEYLKKKSDEQRDLESVIHKSTTLQQTLNYRQLAALNRALKLPNTIFTVESHRGSHNVTYDTARTDLLLLEKYGLFNKSKRGRAFIFMATGDLREKLASLS